MATAIEYGLIAALVGMVAITGFTFIKDANEQHPSKPGWTDTPATDIRATISKSPASSTAVNILETQAICEKDGAFWMSREVPGGFECRAEDGPIHGR